MSQLGIDYSWARPGGAAIAAKGYGFVCRYLSHDTTGKNINASELADLRSHNLGLVLVWESTSNEALNGQAAGKQDAIDALAEANALGVPSSVAIYFAVDFDEADTVAQNSAIYAYFQGVLEVLPKGRVGVYGGYYVVQRVLNQGLATYAWQTLAWSGGQVESRVHIYQNGKSDFNGGADIDEARQSDFGQWGGSVAPVTPTPAPAPAPVVNPTPTPAPVGGNTVVVQPGQNLSVIAAQHGLTLAQIEALNPQLGPSAGRNFNTIFAGDIVHIGGDAPAPAPAPSQRQYTVVDGDNLSSIAARFGISLAQIEALNPQITNPNVIHAGDVINVGGNAPAPAPVNSGTYVTVPSGRDGYLSVLAQKYGSTVSDIVAWNQAKYPTLSANNVQAGWYIRVR